MADIRFTAFVQGINPNTGNGKNPELRHTNSGLPVLNFNTAEPHSTKDPNDPSGYRKTGTTYRKITLWGTLADTWANIQPGTRIEIIGREETREYQTQNGDTGRSLEVTADFIRIAPTKNGQQNQQSNTTAPPTQNAYAGGFGAPQGAGQPQGQAPAQGAPQADPWAQQPSGNQAWGQGAGDDTPPF